MQSLRDIYGKFATKRWSLSSPDSMAPHPATLIYKKKKSDYSKRVIKYGEKNNNSITPNYRYKSNTKDDN